MAAALLAAGGKKVIVLDEKLAWEKPCGGGVTHKALEQYPFLRDGQSEYRAVEDCELISPSGQRARFHLRNPVAIFSRLALNEIVLERARRAGAELRKERVTRITGRAGDWLLTTPDREYRASHVVLAAGARNPFRGQFSKPISANNLMVTAGYFIPGHTTLMQIQFLRGISGYIWIFPRADHISAGIAGKMGETSTAELRRTLELWLADRGFSIEGAQFYSHILPALRPETIEALEVSGEGWALIGDSAGLVDPITGEGLYYALRSAELCAGALLAGEPVRYAAHLEEEILPELRLAARVSHRFYKGKFFGESVLERMVALTQRSATCRELMCDLFAGVQGYRDLRSRLYRSLPAMLAEVLASSLRGALRIRRPSPSSA
jgi:flavin-dependent dehydrogenase